MHGRRSPRPDVLLVGDGTNIHVRRLAEALAGRGLAVELACFEGAPIAGVTLHRLGRLPPSADVRYLVAVPQLARLLWNRRPHLAHGLYASSYGLMLAIASRMVAPARPSQRIVQSALGTDLLVTARERKWRAAAASFVLRSADLVTFNARSLEAEILALAPKARRHRFVWGPGRSLFTGARERHPVAVSTRRLEPDMRIELVVTAWREARRLAPDLLTDWRLVVTHDGSRREEVRRAAGGDPSIELVGTVSYGALHELLLTSRVLISTPVSDATSAALMDGLAAGLTPVVSAIPGALEWVDPEIGEIVPRDPTPAELADAIIRAAQRPGDVTTLRRRVAGIVWEDEIERLVEAYRTIAEFPTPTPRPDHDAGNVGRPSAANAIG